MSNKILFLYFNKKHKEELSKCENIIKALFRKFRKSVVFSYMEIDTSHSCREAFKSLLYKELERNHAVMIKGDYEVFAAEDVFFRDILPFSVAEYYTAGKVLCYPASEKQSEVTEDFVSENRRTALKDMQKAVEVSINLAQSRKKSLLICTGQESLTDENLFRSLQDMTNKSTHIKTEHISPDEIISLCIKTVPSFDVVLSTEEIAKLVGMHLNSGNRICSGFSVFHTDKGMVHMSKTTFYEEMGNSHYASVLLTFSNIVGGIKDMKGAADWLRKAVATAFETYASTSFEEFADKVISEIQKPMRIKK